MFEFYFILLCAFLLIGASPIVYRKILPLFIRYRRPFVAKTSSNKIIVAAIGDSLTYGSTIFQRKDYSYPKCLDVLLGPKYAVRNFGLPYYCAQKRSDFPYWNHPFFERSLSIRPDIVLLMLGTNDSKHSNWKSKECFSADYLELVRHFQTSESSPDIYLMTPPQIFIPKGKNKESFDTCNQNLKIIVEEIRQIGTSLSLSIIDLNQLTIGMSDLYNRDCLHLNRKGANYIAKTVFDALMLEQAENTK